MSVERLVQAAVYDALTGDSAYMALVTGVYDGEPPQDDEVDMPYTVLADWTEADDSTHEADGYELTVTIHDFSDRESRLECQRIREARNTVLRLATLTVTGWSMAKLFYEFGEILIEWDAELKRNIRHQVTRYRVRGLDV